MLKARVKFRLKQLASLTCASFLDVIRQPIILLLMALAIGLTALLPVVSLFMFGDEVRLVRDGALAFQLGVGLLLAGTAAAVSLHREITRGTAAMTLAKPVGRNLFFFTRYIGLVLVLALFMCFNVMTMLLSVRMPLSGLMTDWRVGGLLFAVMPVALLLAGLANYFKRRPFVSQAVLYLLPCLLVAFLISALLAPAGDFCVFGSLLEWRLIGVSILIFFALAEFAAIALALSTRWSPLLTLSVCGLLFFLGLLSDYLLGPLADKSMLAMVLYGMIPNWQNFWMTDALAGGGALSWGYVWFGGLYALLLITATLCLGLISFQQVDVD